MVTVSVLLSHFSLADSHERWSSYVHLFVAISTDDQDVGKAVQGKKGLDGAVYFLIHL